MNILKIVIISLSLLYILSPYDIIADFFPVVGWLDDILILGILIYYLRKGKFPAFLFGNWKTYTNYDQFSNSKDHKTGDFKKEGATESGTKFHEKEKDPHEILGVRPGASSSEIRTAYRLAAQKYHPDKVSHLGREFQELAQKRFIEVQEAYQKLSGKEI